MKHLSLTLLLLSLIGTAFAQTPEFKWAKRIGGNNYTETAKFISCDGAGNVYIAGSFQDSVDFDPGAGSFFMESPTGGAVFIVKLDSAGNFGWAKKFHTTSGTNPLTIRNMRADNAGNVYFIGAFNDTVDFDPNAGTNIIPSDPTGTNDIYIVKLTTAGNLAWADHISHDDFLVDEQANDILPDAFGNVYVCGSFKDTLDLDPGPGVANVMTTNLKCAFVLKLNSTGDLIWAKQTQLPVSTANSGFSLMALSNNGELALHGTFRHNVDINFGTGTDTLHWYTTGNPQSFIVEVDTAGNFVRGKKIFTVPQAGAGASVTSMQYDATGNIVYTGVFTTSTDFDPGAATFNMTPPNSQPDIHITKLNDTLGFVWAKQIGSTGYDEALSLGLDANDNIYISGDFSDVVDFDPGTGTFNLSETASTTLMFIAKYTSAGAFSWATKIGANQPDQALDMFVTPGGAIHNTGDFSGTEDFDPGSGTASITSVLSDVFVHKMEPPTVSVTSLSEQSAYNIYPNPVNEKLVITTEGDLDKVSIRLLSITGQVVMQLHNISGSIYTLDMGSYSSGTYFVELNSAKGQAIFKIIKE